MSYRTDDEDELLDEDSENEVHYLGGQSAGVADTLAASIRFTREYYCTDEEDSDYNNNAYEDNEEEEDDDHRPEEEEEEYMQIVDHMDEEEEESEEEERGEEVIDAGTRLRRFFGIALEDQSESRSPTDTEPETVIEEDIYSILEERWKSQKVGTPKIITEDDVKLGADRQGIPWKKYEKTRERVRESRLKEYRQINQTFSHPQSPIRDETAEYFGFHRNCISECPFIAHFQLCHLLATPTHRDVYYLASKNQVRHWDTVQEKCQQVAQFNKIFETITTMAVNADGLLAVGGWNGELKCLRMNPYEMVVDTRITTEQNGITNGLDFIDNRNGLTCLLTSSNDTFVRLFDIETMKRLNSFKFEFPINFSKLNPSRTLICCVGDDFNGFVVDVNSKQRIFQLHGHTDYGFACDWSVDGNIIATGNQDRTTILHDIRNMSTNLAVLPAKIDAIRSLHFSKDGNFLAAAEATDFCHVYNVRNGFQEEQIIDNFGKIAGMSFTPDNDSLFISIQSYHAAILQYTLCSDFSDDYTYLT